MGWGNETSLDFEYTAPYPMGDFLGGKFQIQCFLTFFGEKCNKPFSNGSIVIHQLFIGVHGLLTQLLARFIHLFHNRYHRMFSLPCHRLRERVDRFLVPQQIAILMLLQPSPHPFNRIVFAVVWRIVSQDDGYLISRSKFNHSLVVCFSFAYFACLWGWQPSSALSRRV
jgi:hypothetical protein